MAFYTYRHVELDRVGCGKRKVLKPPGGGSSDIFGFSSSASDDKLAAKSKKYAPSQFSIGDEVEEDRKPIDLNDGASTPSHSSISNGSPNNSEPNTPRSGTPLLNGPLAYANHHHLPTPSRPKGRRAQVAAAGNPVTGEGYLEGGSEKKEETPRRQRVPPGGFSSKLW